MQAMPDYFNIYYTRVTSGKPSDALYLSIHHPFRPRPADLVLSQKRGEPKRGREADAVQKASE